VLAALINFVVILAIVFLLLKAWNAMKRRTPADDVDTELGVLREIRDSLNRGA
jgi:large-conductance mechanosensitive channel